MPLCAKTWATRDESRWLSGNKSSFGSLAHRHPASHVRASAHTQAHTHQEQGRGLRGGGGTRARDELSEEKLLAHSWPGSSAMLSKSLAALWGSTGRRSAPDVKKKATNERQRESWRKVSGGPKQISGAFWGRGGGKREITALFVLFFCNVKDKRRAGKSLMRSAAGNCWS